MVRLLRAASVNQPGARTRDSLASFVWVPVRDGPSRVGSGLELAHARSRRRTVQSVRPVGRAVGRRRGPAAAGGGASAIIQRTAGGRGSTTAPAQKLGLALLGHADQVCLPTVRGHGGGQPDEDRDAQAGGPGSGRPGRPRARRRVVGAFRRGGVPAGAAPHRRRCEPDRTAGRAVASRRLAGTGRPGRRGRQLPRTPARRRPWGVARAPRLRACRGGRLAGGGRAGRGPLQHTMA